jgi:fructan beta-fructosidase
VAKIWKNDNGVISNVKTARMMFESDRTYHLRVEAVGDLLTVWLDGKEIISVRDSSHTVGALGLNVYNGTAVFNNIKYEEK